MARPMCLVRKRAPAGRPPPRCRRRKALCRTPSGGGRPAMLGESGGFAGPPCRRRPETEFLLRCFCNGPSVVKLQSASSRRSRASARGRRGAATSCCLREPAEQSTRRGTGSLPATAAEPASPSPRPGDGTSREPGRLAPLRTLVGLLAATPPRQLSPCPRRTPSHPSRSGGAPECRAATPDGAAGGRSRGGEDGDAVARPMRAAQPQREP